MDISFVPFCIMLSAMGLSLHFVPLHTRPDLYFGITVSPAFRRTAPARRLLRNYRLAVWCLTIGALAAGGAYGHAQVVLAAYLAGVCAALVIAHRSAEQHTVAPVTAMEVDLAAPAERLPGGLPAVILPKALLIGIGAWALAHPATAVPSAAMTPLVSAGMMPLVSAGLSCLMLSAMAYGVLHGSRRISASGPGAAAERVFRRRIVLCLIAGEYFLVLLAGSTVLGVPRVVLVSTTAAFVVGLAAGVVTLFRAGQGGARLWSAPRAPVIGDRSPDDCWKGGLLYVNPRDHAIFVEKRMGIGYTLNFGNPWSWLLLGAVLAIPLGLYLLRQPIMMRQPITAESVNATDKASPGTEASLRRYIDSLEGGRPNYEEMSPRLAAAVNRQLPAIMGTIRKMGEFKSLTYEGVDPTGSDVYDARFEHGHLQWHVAPLAVDGKVIGRSFRSLGANAEG